MPFYPLFKIRLEPNINYGNFNEGLYVMTKQTDTVEIGVLIGLMIGPDRIARVIITPDYSRLRSNPFPDRRHISNIQLRDKSQLTEFFKTRQQPHHLHSTAPNSAQELQVVKQWFQDAADDLRHLK